MTTTLATAHLIASRLARRLAAEDADRSSGEGPNTSEGAADTDELSGPALLDRRRRRRAAAASRQSAARRRGLVLRTGAGAAILAGAFILSKRILKR